MITGGITPTPAAVISAAGSSGSSLVTTILAETGPGTEGANRSATSRRAPGASAKLVAPSTEMEG